ncbi:MAG: methyltransferase domain-containing protein [Verrucomicrobia bacterium]|nr:methyltransferase domain-containing protein [Verrucomicrobiota bacterium]MBU6446566.1 methyltransferase domain-containing protein [Verrucomicrobiota bacterium]MDE3047856.1 class I SAM-dependent methyltransferase [Verrucomicrobiota bacterium]
MESSNAKIYAGFEHPVNHPQETAFNYDSIPTGYYDAIFHRKKGIQSCWHYLKFLGVSHRIAPTVTTLLDIGCGPGTFLGNFIGPHIQAVGFDIASGQIDYAMQKYGRQNITFICGKDRLPFADSSFDAVTCIELIEHLAKDQIDALLKECYRVLTPKGRLILTTPNYKSLWVVLEKMVNRLSPVSYEDQHISRFNPHILRECLETHGFQANVKSYLGIAPFLALLSNRLATQMFKYEKWIENRYGFLLIADCEKNR